MLHPLSHYLPEIPLAAIERATAKRGGGPPVSMERALAICGRLHEIDMMPERPLPTDIAAGIIAEYMQLEHELLGLGSGSGD